MSLQSLVNTWFEKWEKGEFLDLPITPDFRHVSPFGTIEGKQTYIDLVKANQDRFLGYRFDIHDRIFDGDRGCVRYTAVQGDFRLDVSEWYFARDGLIGTIMAYYHIGEIRADRKLADPE